MQLKGATQTISTRHKTQTAANEKFLHKYFSDKENALLTAQQLHAYLKVDKSDMSYRKLKYWQITDQIC